MKEYLQQLGVEEQLISEEDKKFLDQNGYLNLGKVMSNEEVGEVLTRIKSLLKSEGSSAGAELIDSSIIKHPKEKGVDRLADLVNKGSIFDLFFTNPRVLAAIAHVLNQDFKLSSLNYRAALPGEGLQKLHVDWSGHISPGDYRVCNSIWLLDDFSRNNGCTRIVPGTNHSDQLPEEVLTDPLAPHPEEVLIEAPAGTVVVFNSHTWHGGTTNNSNAPRRAIHSYFCRRNELQQIDQSKYITDETRKRLSKQVQYLIDV